MALLKRSGRVRRRARAWWLLLAAITPPRLSAQQSGPLEYRVKAAYLLNFTRYVEWP